MTLIKSQSFSIDDVTITKCTMTMSAAEVAASGTDAYFYVFIHPVDTIAQNDTFGIGDVDLFAGSAARDYQQKNPGSDMAECQRYLVVYGGSAAYERIACGLCYSTKYANFVLALPVEMRAAPTQSVSAAADFATYTGAAAIIACNEFLSSFANKRQCSFILGQAGTSNVAGDGAIAITNNTTAARLYLSAEL